MDIIKEIFRIYYIMRLVNIDKKLIGISVHCCHGSYRFENVNRRGQLSNCRLVGRYLVDLSVDLWTSWSLGRLVQNPVNIYNGNISNNQHANISLYISFSVCVFMYV